MPERGKAEIFFYTSRRRAYHGGTAPLQQGMSGITIEPRQPVFFTQNLHHPSGLISPSTSVQAFGSWNSEQLLHF